MNTDWSIPATDSNTKRINLPEIVSANGFLSQPLPIPLQLVEGLIHQGTLTMFAGGSKAAKSFTALDLAISISQGLPFWERSVEKGRVLYVNFELAESFLQQRLGAVGKAKGLILDDDETLALPGLDLWNLRGYAASANLIMPEITERCRNKAYSMIILDPFYKLIGGRNENAAGEMCEVLNYFDKLAHETGAAVVYSHHFAKGLAANKEQLDRASGSGVFARHADAIITITPHQEEGAVVVEATLRNLRAPSPFVMRWSYPLMRIAGDLDPRKFKSAPGRKSKYTVDDLLDCLVDAMTTGDWQAATKQKTGMSESTFAEWKKKAIQEGRVEEKAGRWYRRQITKTFDPLRSVAASGVSYQIGGQHSVAIACRSSSDNPVS